MGERSLSVASENHIFLHFDNILLKGLRKSRKSRPFFIEVDLELFHTCFASPCPRFTDVVVVVFPPDNWPFCICRP